MWFDPSCPSDAVLLWGCLFPQLLQMSVRRNLSCFSLHFISHGSWNPILRVHLPAQCSPPLESHLTVSHCWGRLQPLLLPGQGWGSLQQPRVSPTGGSPSSDSLQPRVSGVCVYVLVCWFAVCGGALCISVSADRSLLDSYSLLAG